MTTLRVIEGGHGVEAFEGRPFDLTGQPARPGLAHEPFTLQMAGDTGRSLLRAAASERIPAAMWATIAIESERSLSAVARAGNVDPLALVACLDQAARSGSGIPQTGAGRRLTAYARALRRGCAVEAIKMPLRLSVPYHSLVAWQRSAAAAGMSVSAWALRMLISLPEGRVAWEAAAAERGETLAEWVLLQAALRSSS